VDVYLQETLCVLTKEKPVNEAERQALERALFGLESTAFNFSLRFITDEQGRLAYNRQAKAAVEEILMDVESGRKTHYEAMNIAHEMRNNLMELMRSTRTSEPTLARAFKVTRLPTSHPDRIKVSLAAAMPMANARTFCIPSQMALGPG
jgi:hypothetical protein